MKKCIICKKQLSKTSCRRKSSKMCKSCYLNKLRKWGKKHPLFRPGHIAYCLKCKEKLEPSAYYARTKLCQKCYLKTIKGKNHPNFKKGLPRCIDCKKEICRGHKRCWSCYVKWSQIPEHNPAHINGNSHLPYPPEWHQIRKIIRQRDKYRCIICLKFGKIVHHIDYNKKNCEENNLITLCIKHHIITNSNRDYWYAYFLHKMENR